MICVKIVNANWLNSLDFPSTRLFFLDWLSEVIWHTKTIHFLSYFVCKTAKNYLFFVILEWRQCYRPLEIYNVELYFYLVLKFLSLYLFFSDLLIFSVFSRILLFFSHTYLFLPIAFLFLLFNFFTFSFVFFILLFKDYHFTNRCWYLE